jgi:hypothetical protein
VLLNLDYRSRAIGVVAAMGVLITGVVVTGARARVPQPTADPAVTMATMATKTPPTAVARRES